MLDLLHKAYEAVTAEHAFNAGFHISKGCHGCVVFADFKKYVLEVAQHYPVNEQPVLAVSSEAIRFCLWVAPPLTPAKWKTIAAYFAVLEPDAPTPAAKEETDAE